MGCSPQRRRAQAGETLDGYARSLSLPNEQCLLRDPIILGLLSGRRLLVCRQQVGLRLAHSTFHRPAFQVGLHPMERGNPVDYSTPTETCRHRPTNR